MKIDSANFRKRRAKEQAASVQAMETGKRSMVSSEYHYSAPEIPSSSEGATRRLLTGAVRMICIILSVAGFVPKHATAARIAAMSAALALSYYLALFQPHSQELAVLYALGTILCYVGFLFAVLRRNGARHWFTKRFGGEEKGYLAFQTILGFLFFHNGVAIAYVASSSRETAFAVTPKWALLSLAAALFVMGCATKLWAATAVSIDIYYWKDMFIGRKVCDFVETGPYKYLSNPMYGVGQLQAYAVAVWYGSPWGLLVAFINQCCVFLFYFAVEEPFIQRVYVKQAATARLLERERLVARPERDLASSSPVPARTAQGACPDAVGRGLYRRHREWLRPSLILGGLLGDGHSKEAVRTTYRLTGRATGTDR